MQGGGWLHLGHNRLRFSEGEKLLFVNPYSEILLFSFRDLVDDDGGLSSVFSWFSKLLLSWFSKLFFST